MGRTLVIPSNRPERLADFFKSWGDRGGWDSIIVIQDKPKVSDSDFVVTDGHEGLQFAWDAIDATMKDKAWIFSRRDAAIRAYGFYQAWACGADYVLTLDDDCYPKNTKDIFLKTLFDRHIAAMNEHKRWTGSCPFRTRGIPYRNEGSLETVKASMGLWSGVPDFDAIQSLNPTTFVWGNATGGWINEPRLIPHGQYFPLCDMNMCVKREAIPCFYRPLMGEGYPYRRFDDIWCGIIAKKVFDHLGWHFSVGGCIVNHERASDPFVNLIKEAPGIQANETFWQIVDGCCLTGASTADQAMHLIGCGLQKFGHDDKWEYLDKLGQAIQVWASLFKTKE
jgi:reversibly glycosylated polypeptide/UDP-arabinopyranose mutase